MKRLADDEQVQIEKLEAQMQFDSALSLARSLKHKLEFQDVVVGVGDASALCDLRYKEADAEKP